MSRKDLDQYTKMFPQFSQSDQNAGAQKAIVIDNNDPLLLGGIKPLMYGAQADYLNLDISTIDWVYPAFGNRGSFCPPEIGDRVLVTFENGDKKAGLWWGYWPAAPMGDGTLMWNKRMGAEIRPEFWHHRNRYPESNGVGSTGAGSIIGMSDLFMDRENLASYLSLIDVGGKYCKFKSFFVDAVPWSPIDQIEESEGSLYKGDFGENKATRTGFETTADLDPQAGSIDIGHQRLKHQMIASDSDFSLDQRFQYTDETTITHEVQSIGGNAFKIAQDAANLTMMKNAIFLSAPGNVLINNVLHPPKRYDKAPVSNQSDNTGGGGDSGGQLA